MGAALNKLDPPKVTENPHAKRDAHLAAMEIERRANSVRRQDTPTPAPRQAHFWIDETTGLIKRQNDQPTDVYCYVKDIARVDTVPVNNWFNVNPQIDKRIVFKNNLPNPDRECLGTLGCTS